MKSPAYFTSKIYVLRLAAIMLPLCSFFSCKSREEVAEQKFAMVLGSDRAVDRVMKMGAEQAAAELGMKISIMMSGADVSSQSDHLSEQYKQGVAGLAVSLLDAQRQKSLLNQVAGSARLIVMGSDAPDSKRHAFVGVDPYAAGRMAGQLVKEAMPQGGRVAIFLGYGEDPNELLRRQGVIDELLDRTNQVRRLDELGALINGGKYQVLATLIDQGDAAVAGCSVDDLLKKDAAVGCTVGLQGYHAPMLLAKLGENHRLGQIKVVAFDEELATLDGIVSGHVQGTVVQDPFACGYQTVKLLKELSNIPISHDEGKADVMIAARIIRKDNVASFREDWESKTGAK
jgi:ribose transport system substrate-binding protein